MNVTDKNSIITRDDVYSYADAMQIMDVSHGTLYGGITNGLLHPVSAEQIYGMHGKKKYLLKSEVEPLRGIRTLRKDVVEIARRNSDLPTIRGYAGGSLDDLTDAEISSLPGLSKQNLADRLLDAFNKMCDTLRTLEVH